MQRDRERDSEGEEMLNEKRSETDGWAPEREGLS